MSPGCRQGTLRLPRWAHGGGVALKLPGVYYGREGDAVAILLCGGEKRSQARDIERAEAYWRDYRSRDHGEG
jgi:putative addiction module killer protein